MRSAASFLAIAFLCGACGKREPAPAPPAAPESPLARSGTSATPLAPDTSTAPLAAADTDDTATERDAQQPAARAREDLASYAARAAADRSAEAQIANTIHAGFKRPRVDAVGNSERACELGDWRSCAWLADRRRQDACPDHLFVSYGEIVPDPTIGEGLDATASGGLASLDTKAHAAAERACEAGDRDACWFVGMRTLSGCGRTRDIAHGRERVDRLLSGLAANCAAAPDTGRLVCDELASRCRDVRSAMVGGTEPAQSAVVPVASVKASSVLPPWKGYHFHASQVVDKDWTTSWQPLERRRGGVGQWLELRFEGRPLVNGVSIGNGLQKKDALGDLFLMNNRVARGRLEFDDGSVVAFSLAADKRGLSELRFPARPTHSIRLVVDAIHRGSKWNDLAISEISVSGIAAEGASAELPAACVNPGELSKEACERGVSAACNAYTDVADPELRAVARAFAAKVMSRHCAEAKGATRACSSAADFMATSSEEARALLERGCRLGDSGACGELGCHPRYPDEDEDVARRFGEPAPELCEAACDGGDDAACLALAGARSDDAASVDFDHSQVKKVLARRATCTSAQHCLALGTQLASDNGGRGGMDLVVFVASYAAWHRGCELGSVGSCEALAELIELWMNAPERVAAAHRRACDGGSAMACQALLGRAPEVKGKLEAAVKALVASCEAGELDACEDARIHVDEPEKERLDAHALTLLSAACEAGQGLAPCLDAAERERDAEKRSAFRRRALVAGLKPCMDKGVECGRFCELAADLATGGAKMSFIDPELGVDTLREITEILKTPSAEELQDLCIDVELDDPCACGCC